MKNSIIYIFIISIFSLKCNTINDPVPEILTRTNHPLCMIDTDGKNHQIIEDEIADGYERAFLHVLNDDKILIMWSKFIHHFGISNSELKFIKMLPIDNILDLVVSPDNQFFVFVGVDSSAIDLYYADISGNNLIKLTNSPTLLEWGPSFSIDGSKIIFTTNHNYDISYYDLQTDSIYTVLSLVDSTSITSNSSFNFPCFSSEDNQIFYIKRNSISAGDTLFQYNIATDTYNILDTEVYYARKLFISQSRNRLVYFKYGNPGAIASCFTDGSNKAILSNEVSHYCKYDISDNGEKILYWEPYAINGSIENPLYIINSDGSNSIDLGIGSNATFYQNNKIVFAGFYKTK